MAPFFDLHGDPTMDPYTILGIPPTATEAEIKRSYRMQMLQLHPDKLSPSLSETDIADISDKFHNVKDAYEFLTSPLHLASRRLYMTKMASRRAEYERREAYLRRNGGVDSRSNSVAGGGASSSAVPSGYSTGGGGAAGMAGTGMPTQPPQQQPPSQQQQHHATTTGNSYAMPKSKNTRHRAKSEPEVDGGGHTGGNERRRHHSKTNGGGYYKNMGGQRDSRGRSGHHNPTTTKHREASSRGRGAREQNGYKSDSHAMKTKSQHRDRQRRSSNVNAKDGRERQQQQQPHHHRGKSEELPNHNDKHYRTRSTGGGGDRERRTKEKRRPSTTTHARDYSRDNRERERESSDNKRRGRATSAPARYSSKSAKYKEDMRGSSNSNSLPKEFFCPLTKRIMKDPVKDTEGNTYEREAIERWLRVQSSSPITNRYLSLGMIRPDKELKRAIYKVTGKPRSKSQARTRSPPSRDLVSGRVLIDSYLREISSKSTLSVSLDGTGICAFSYRRLTFVIEVPITPNAGFMVYSSFDGEADKYKLSEKIDAWNKWFMKIRRHSRVSHIKAGQKTVFTLKGSDRDMSKCEVFQKTLEYFVEMSLKLHNLIHPMETKAVENVCLTRTPVPVT